jgi:hypothetical protein
MALLWHLFARLAWAQPATVLTAMTDLVAALASVSLVGMGPESHCGGGHEW